MAAPTLEEIRAWPAAVSVPRAAAALGISRSHAYRFVVLTLTRSFLGRENPKLTAQLLGELPGILSWSLDGLDALTRAGALAEPASSADAIVALQDLVSPVSAFVRDWCIRGGEVAVNELFTAWKQWCEVNWHKHGSVQTFGRDLRAVIPALRVVQPRDGKTRERRYVGLRLNDPADPASARTDDGSDRVPSRADRFSPSPTRDGTRDKPSSAVQSKAVAPLRERLGGVPLCDDCGAEDSAGHACPGQRRAS